MHIECSLCIYRDNRREIRPTIMSQVSEVRENRSRLRKSQLVRARAKSC